MHEWDISAGELVDSLLCADAVGTCILDSCGVGDHGTRLLIGSDRSQQFITAGDGNTALLGLDGILGRDKAVVFTLSYDLANHIHGVSTARDTREPLAFFAEFNSIVVHDYDSGRTYLAGDREGAQHLKQRLTDARRPAVEHVPASSARSNVTRAAYLQAIDTIHEEIRKGNTYQTNLTRSIEARLPLGASEPAFFRHLRSNHPAPFSAYIRRSDSTVVSASPERFFKVKNGSISASPIKGTRPRGFDPADDERLRCELLYSEKDRAENTMIVDLLRNDLGRICTFGSVAVDKLCEIEEHPSLFHLVSTISGNLRPGLKFSEILTALFPCGSITGAPKLSTMRLIDRLETSPRGLSMGAIGYYLPASFGFGEMLDLSVAIRTMVIANGLATFNVGGGIVIDSDPEKEWDETTTKSRALLDSLGLTPEDVAD